MRYRSRHLTFAGGGAILVAVLTGCGGADTDPAGAQSASATANTPESGSTAPTSGRSSSSNTPPGSTTARPDDSGDEQDGSGQAAAAPCAAGNVEVTLGKGSAAAGSYYAPLRFTNSGAQPCVIAGYPGVSYVAGEDAHQVGPAAQRVGDRSPTVSLAPGEVAHATVRFLRAHNYPAEECGPTDVRALRVYPPGETAWALVSHPGTGCASDDMSGPQLTVKPVKPGPGGRQG